MAMRGKAVRIPKPILEEIVKIRGQEEVDMKFVEQVQSAATRLGYHETAAWIHDNRNLYLMALEFGFEELGVDLKDEFPCASTVRISPAKQRGDRRTS